MLHAVGQIQETENERRRAELCPVQATCGPHDLACLHSIYFVLDVKHNNEHCGGECMEHKQYPFRDRYTVEVTVYWHKSCSAFGRARTFRCVSSCRLGPNCVRLQPHRVGSRIQWSRVRVATVHAVREALRANFVGDNLSGCTAHTTLAKHTT